MFRFGLRSRLELHGVHPRLVAVVRRAIQITEQDFRVVDGLRTPEQQAEYVARGASQTLNSLHLRQPDGYGHAVDLVPVINGAPRWEWPLIYPVARAMHEAATEAGVPLVWGGCWDRPFLALSRPAIEIEVEHYAERERARKRMRGQRETVFLDGPHYQLGQFGVPA